MNAAEKFARLTSAQRLEKIKGIIERASDRTGKLEAVLLTEAEVLGIYLLTQGAPPSGRTE